MKRNDIQKIISNNFDESYKKCCIFRNYYELKIWHRRRNPNTKIVKKRKAYYIRKITFSRSHLKLNINKNNKISLYSHSDIYQFIHEPEFENVIKKFDFIIFRYSYSPWSPPTVLFQKSSWLRKS